MISQSFNRSFQKSHQQRKLQTDVFFISVELADILLQQAVYNVGTLKYLTSDMPLVLTVAAEPVLPLQEFDLLKESAVVYTNFCN